MSAILSNAHPSTMDLAVQAHVSGRTADAESLYRRVLHESPSHPQANQFLGVLLFQSGNRGEGVSFLEKATDLMPNDAEAWSNLGNAYRVLEKGKEAVDALRKAIKINPNNASAHCTLSACLRREGTLGEAVECARNAIRLQPNLAQSHLNLGCSLLESGDTAGALVALEQALYTSPAFLEAHQSFVFGLHYSDRHSATDIFRAAQRLGAMFPAVGYKAPDRSLKTIAFLSGDFHRHPVSYFLEPVLRSFPRDRYHVVLLSNSNREDVWTEKLRDSADEWHTVADLGPTELQGLTAQIGVDMVVDLSGHTASNRIDALAQRIAPVQVSWLGYSGTTGVATIDWIIADDILVQDSEEAVYSERVARLPNSVFCFDPGRITVSLSEPPCVENGFVTFGSFNNLSKLSPGTVSLWSQVLNQVQGSKLLLKSLHLGEPRIAERLRRQFVLRGVDADRVQISGYLPHDDHYSAYANIDIALDPFPYTGATTTIEALHMGVPVVTLKGDRYAGRMSSSLLHSIQRDEWIAGSKSDYVQTAAALANDPERLLAVRATLRDEVARSPLCQPGPFAHDLATTFEMIWAQAQNTR